jgi:hypothetical protein
MKKSLIRHSLGLAVVLSFASLANPYAHAQGTIFTYQGRLDDQGAPSSGPHDFVFRLFDAASGGAQIGSTVCVDNVNVIDGVFTAELDFGQQFATTAERHLEIEVRSDTGLPCGDGTGFVVLSPRQRVTAAPMASHAGSAFTLAAADGTPANAVFVNNDGKVGVGTTSPATHIHVRGTGPVMVLQDMASASNQAGYIGFWNDAAAETGWMGYGSPGSPHFSMFNARSGGGLKFWTAGTERLAITSTGNVGVGTSTPAARLDVRGDVRLGASGEFFAVRSPASDRSLRGTILFNGNIDATRSSPGFTVTHNSTGVFTLNFTVPFTSPPTVVVSATALCCRARVTSTATGTAFVHVLDYDTDVLTDSPFTFIAIGP